MTRLLDQLPAVFRSDEQEQADFLPGFLAAFERVFESLQLELDRLPELFALVPRPQLEAPTSPERRTLDLISAAGLRPGDVLELRDRRPERTEYVEVGELRTYRGDPTPRGVVLADHPRFGHATTTPIHVLGGVTARGTLGLPAARGDSDITAADPGAPAPAPGDVVRIDEGPDTEHTLVTAVVEARIWLARPLEKPHRLGCPLVRVERAAVETPSAAFPWAARDGAEFVLDADALAGQRWLELDTYEGVAVGDLLHLRDHDPAAVQFVTVAALARRSPLRAHTLRRRALRIADELTHAHGAGMGVSVVGEPVAASRLATARSGASIQIAEPLDLDAQAGDVLRLGDGPFAYAQAIAVAGDTITITPVPGSDHPAGTVVAKMASQGAAVGLLAWLAGWIGLRLRDDRGERWNRELVRRAGRIWPLRGTRPGLEALLDAYLRGEADASLFDIANPLQIGLVSRVGVDTAIRGGPPGYFVVDLKPDRRNTRMRSATGAFELAQVTRTALRSERPAHTYYDIRVAPLPMQLGVDRENDIGARVGETTLLWGEPLMLQGDR